MDTLGGLLVTLALGLVGVGVIGIFVALLTPKKRKKGRLDLQVNQVFWTEADAYGGIVWKGRFSRAGGLSVVIEGSDTVNGYCLVSLTLPDQGLGEVFITVNRTQGETNLAKKLDPLKAAIRKAIWFEIADRILQGKVGQVKPEIGKIIKDLKVFQEP